MSPAVSDAPKSRDGSGGPADEPSTVRVSRRPTAQNQTRASFGSRLAMVRTPSMGRAGVVVGVMLGLAVACCAPAVDAAETLVVPPNVRLLVVAPHPDDESLGAGGLMQRTLAAGGRVHVLFLTNGDGYPEAVEVATGHREPSASDYRGFGELRRAEALVALERYRVLPLSVTFLGF